MAAPGAPEERVAMVRAAPCTNLLERCSSPIQRSPATKPAAAREAEAGTETSPATVAAEGMVRSVCSNRRAARTAVQVETEAPAAMVERAVRQPAAAWSVLAVRFAQST